MLSHRTLLGLLILTLWPGLTLAQVPQESRGPDPDNKTDKLQTVEFFQAMKDGQLEVKFIPLSDEAANVLIQNKTKQALKVQLPEVFAGVPVLAQMGMGPMGGGGNANSGAQGLGGGMNAGGGGRQGNGGNQGFGGGPGGLFNIAPEKTGKLTVPCVCLDHGKPNPTPRMAYKIVPAEEYVKRPAVIELLKVFGQGKIDRAAAQAAAWNMNNDLSWQELANMRIFSRKYVGGSIPYFQQKVLQQAHRLATQAQEQAQPDTSKSPGQQTVSVGTEALKIQPISATEK